MQIKNVSMSEQKSQKNSITKVNSAKIGIPIYK